MIQNKWSLNNHRNVEKSNGQMKEVLHQFNNEENCPEWKKSKYYSQHNSGIECKICKLEWLHEVVMDFWSDLKKYAYSVLTSTAEFLGAAQTG